MVQISLLQPPLGDSCVAAAVDVFWCHGHTEAEWRQPELLWSCSGPGAPQCPGWDSLGSPRKVPCLALVTSAMTGFF